MWGAKIDLSPEQFPRSIPTRGVWSIRRQRIAHGREALSVARRTARQS